MAEVLVQFDEPQRASDGRLYSAQVRGRRVGGGGWEAWIEFLPLNGGDPLRTGTETEQFSRGDLRYWAARLTHPYLEEALSRALDGRAPYPGKDLVPSGSTQGDGEKEQVVLQTDSLTRPRPVIDPVTLYRHNGEYALRQALHPLDAVQLRDIIAAYDIPDIDTADVARTFEDSLVEQIVACVQQRVGYSRPKRPSSWVRNRE